jgi:hypothetical protein
LKQGDIIKFNGELGEAIFNSEDKSFRFYPVHKSRYYTSQLEIIPDLDSDEYVTTHEEKILFLKQRFPWGNIIETYDFEEYVIFKYVSIFNGKEQGIQYHGYINYKDTNHSEITFDKMLITILSIKYEGLNSQAGLYFCKMLGIDVNG